MTVGRKLYAGFTIELVIMLVVSMVGLYRMNFMNTQAKEITNNWLPGVELMNDINYLTEHVLVQELKLIVEPDQSRLGVL